MITVGIIGSITPRGDGNHAIETLTNISKGIQMAEAIAKEGFAPFCPFLDFAYFIVGSYLTDEQIKAISIEWITRCDAVYLCEGWKNSRGSIAEMELAKDKGIPRFESISALKEWRDKKKYAATAKRDEGPKVNGRIEAMEENLKATILEIEMLKANLRAHEMSMEKLAMPSCIELDDKLNGLYSGKYKKMTDTCPAWLYYSKSSWGKELRDKIEVAHKREAFARNEISQARDEIQNSVDSHYILTRQDQICDTPASQQNRGDACRPRVLRQVSDNGYTCHGYHGRSRIGEA